MVVGDIREGEADPGDGDCGVMMFLTMSGATLLDLKLMPSRFLSISDPLILGLWIGPWFSDLIC